jgi:hypothetical protein
MEEATARIASKLQVQYEECPTVSGSVGDPDPDPQDPYVFGPPGSGSFSQRYGRLRILPFSHKGLEQTEIMLAK